MHIAKSDMLDLLNGLEHTALAALEGKTTKRDIQELFDLIKKPSSNGRTAKQHYRR